jgi:hypothetical protein
MMNGVAEAANDSGNPNHSLLIGTITGFEACPIISLATKLRLIQIWSFDMPFP